MCSAKKEIYKLSPIVGDMGCSKNGACYIYTGNKEWIKELSISAFGRVFVFEEDEEETWVAIRQRAIKVGNLFLSTRLVTLCVVVVKNIFL